MKTHITLQIVRVPVEVQYALRAQAALAGKFLQDYLRDELTKLAQIGKDAENGR